GGGPRGPRLRARVPPVVGSDMPVERGVVKRCGEVARGPGVHSLLHGGGESDWLERRARLPLGGRGEVELAAGRAGRYSRERADRAGRGVDGDDRAGGVVPRVNDARQRPDRGCLQARPYRGVDPQPAVLYSRRPVLLLQEVLDVADEVRLAARVRGARPEVEAAVAD